VLRRRRYPQAFTFTKCYIRCLYCNSTCLEDNARFLLNCPFRAAARADMLRAICTHVVLSHRPVPTPNGRVVMHSRECSRCTSPLGVLNSTAALQAAGNELLTEIAGGSGGGGRHNDTSPHRRWSRTKEWLPAGTGGPLIRIWTEAGPRPRFSFSRWCSCSVLPPPPPVNGPASSTWSSCRLQEGQQQQQQGDTEHRSTQNTEAQKKQGGAGAGAGAGAERGAARGRGQWACCGRGGPAYCLELLAFIRAFKAKEWVQHLNRCCMCSTTSSVYGSLHWHLDICSRMGTRMNYEAVVAGSVVLTPPWGFQELLTLG
jgi:hypothetical protein